MRQVLSGLMSGLKGSCQSSRRVKVVSFGSRSAAVGRPAGTHKTHKHTHRRARTHTHTLTHTYVHVPTHTYADTHTQYSCFPIQANSSAVCGLVKSGQLYRLSLFPLKRDTSLPLCLSLHHLTSGIKHQSQPRSHLSSTFLHN